jgi:hypothetical protein
MKRDLAIFILSLITMLTATSCIKEGAELCEAELTLKFHLTETPDEKFGEYIGSVEVFLFDDAKNLHTHKRLERAELDRFLGTTFSLDPGTYYAVCWANADEHSQFSEMDAGSAFESAFIRIDSDDTDDPIYYAAVKAPASRSGNEGNGGDGDYELQAVDVPYGHTVRDLEFVKAHRVVQVYIQGYEYTQYYDGKAPVVKRTGASDKFDFLLHPDLNPVAFEQTSTPVQTNWGLMYRVDFYSKLVPLQDDMEVTLFHPTTGERIAGVNLKQYVQDNGIKDDSVIPILFVFSMDAQVTVTLPSWQNNPVEID